MPRTRLVIQFGLAALLLTEASADLAAWMQGNSEAPRALARQSFGHFVATIERVEDHVFAKVQKQAGDSIAAVRLKSDYYSVSRLALAANGSRLVVVGNAGAPRVSIVDLKERNVVAEFYAYDPVLSPDLRAIAFESFRGRGEDPAPPAQYMVLPLNAPGQDAAQSLLKDAGGHQRKSQLQWVSDDLLAFLDRNDDVTRLVVAFVNSAGGVTRVIQRDLDTDALVDASAVVAGVPPAAAIDGATISRLAGEGLVLRLRFPPSPGLKVNTVDVRVR